MNDTDKLYPEDTYGETMDQAGYGALSTRRGAFGANLVDWVRDNPIPVAVIGAGIAWLVAGSRQTGMSTRVSHRVGDRVGEMSRRSQAQYYRAKDQFGNLLDQKPLVVGALGIVLGTALGAAMPSTRRESRLMGNMRDDVVERAKASAREQADAVKQSAQRVAELAKQEAGRVKDDLAKAATQSPGQGGATSSVEEGSSQSGGMPGQQSIH